MQESLPDFQPLIRALTDNGIRFVLIGGLAMVARGSAHVTQDIDICYARDADNLSLISAIFNAHNVHLRGVPKDLPFVFDPRTLKNALNLTLETDLGNRDILGEPAGVDSFDGLWERSATIEIYGISVQVASIADLLSMKRAANRPKDQNHILELLELQKLIETSVVLESL